MRHTTTGGETRDLGLTRLHPWVEVFAASPGADAASYNHGWRQAARRLDRLQPRVERSANWTRSPHTSAQPRVEAHVQLAKRIVSPHMRRRQWTDSSPTRPQRPIDFAEAVDLQPQAASTGGRRWQTERKALTSSSSIMLTISGRSRSTSANGPTSLTPSTSPPAISRSELCLLSTASGRSSTSCASSWATR